MLEVLTNKVTVELNVFGTCMKYIIVGNDNGTAIVTMKRNTDRLRRTHVNQKPTKPNKFKHGISKSTIFYFGTRMDNNSLLLATPKYEGGAT